LGLGRRPDAAKFGEKYPVGNLGSGCVAAKKERAVGFVTLFGEAAFLWVGNTSQQRHSTHRPSRRVCATAYTPLPGPASVLPIPNVVVLPEQDNGPAAAISLPVAFPML